jgi:hypothetical protein
MALDAGHDRPAADQEMAGRFAGRMGLHLPTPVLLSSLTGRWWRSSTRAGSGDQVKQTWSPV